MRKNFRSPIKFMSNDSFNTSKDNFGFLTKYPSIVEDPKLELMQNKVPKVDKVRYERLKLSHDHVLNKFVFKLFPIHKIAPNCRARLFKLFPNHKIAPNCRARLFLWNGRSTNT